MGRMYLIDNESLHMLGLAFVLAGLAYIPLCLIEFDTGPVFYQLVYGSHPYQFDGAERFIGHRPLVFLEHGNQLGSWVATSAVAAVWLWRSGRLPSVTGASGAVAATALVALCLLCQSLGSIVLMIAVLVPVIAASGLGRDRYRVIVVGAIATVVLIGLLLVSGMGIGRIGMRGKVREMFSGIGKGSFTWRLARYEENVPRALENPLVGSARPNWSVAPDRTFFDPAALGLWLFALGSYGVVGLVLVASVFMTPIVEVLKWLPIRSWLNPGSSAVTLAAVLLLMNGLDALFNSVFVLPLLAGAGGIHSWYLEQFRRHG